MKTKSSKSAFFNVRMLIGFMSLAGIFAVLLLSNAFAQPKGKDAAAAARPAPAWSTLPESQTAGIPDSGVSAPEQSQTTAAKPAIVPDTLFNCSWSVGPVTPVALLDSPVVTVGGNMYLFGGVQGGAISAASFKFDGTTWTSIAALPAALEFAAAVTDGTNCYILGGAASTGTPQTTLYRYNVAANTYTTLAPFTTGVWNHSAVYLAGKIYKFAGTGPGTASTNVHEIYTVATNTWAPGAAYPLAISFTSGWTQGGFIYGAGGIDSVTSTGSAKTFRYDPGTNTWDDAAIADLPATRWGAATAVYDTDVVLAGGYVAGSVTANISPTVISWNSGTSWQSVPDMMGAPSGTHERSRFTAAVLNGSFYAVGGRSMASAAFAGTNSNQKLLCINTPTTIINSSSSSLQTEGCSPANMVLDPGETVTVSFCVRNVGNLDSTSALTGTLQATGGVTNPSGPQNYGVVVAGGAPVCRNFTFTVDPMVACGGTVTATIQFQDGANNLGNVTYTFNVGIATIIPPALPSGWTADQGTNSGGFPMWVTSNSGTPTPVADTAPNAAFSQDPANLLDNRLYTPTVMYPSGAQLMFRQNYDLEQQTATAAYDAGILQISINGGAYADIVTAGGSFVQGGYNHTSLNTGFANPLLADSCPGGVCGNWSGISNGGTGGFETCLVNLPAAGVGMPVKFRWRMGSDNSVSRAGWRVDTVKILDGANAIFTQNFEAFACCSSAPTVSTAVSLKTHGGAGDFGIDLPLAGTSGVECRNGGATNDFTIKVTFSGNVAVTGTPQAQVTAGTATIGSGGVANGGMVTVMGNMVLIPLTNVADQQTITVKLNGVTGAADAPAVDVSIPMSRLLGDSNGNRAVNASDVSQVKGRIGQTVTSVNFRSDLNANGAINAGDASIAKANSGHAVP